MAYNLLGIGQAQAGLNLLLVAVELHPKEANLFDSIGEFYLNLKQNEKAIEYYQKALEIDPNYPNARVAKEIISKLKN
jgi:tetratricopeptide (TPR) repeat protein